MIRVHVLPNMFDQGRHPVHELEEPVTVGEIVRRYKPEKYDDEAIAVSINGGRVRELDQVVGDGASVVVCPKPVDILGYVFGNLGSTGPNLEQVGQQAGEATGEPAAGDFLSEPATIGALLTVGGLTYLAGYYLGPDVGDPPAERGNETSQTYAWDRIRTEYRAGFPVPMVFGEHDVGGQVVYTEVVAFGPTQELLRVVLILSEGRCESIGDETGGTGGEFEFGGGTASGIEIGLQFKRIGTLQLPRNIRVNGTRLEHTVINPGVLAYIRLGEIAQSPVASPPFSGASAVIPVNAPLNSVGSVIATINDTDQIDEVTAVIEFPAGKFVQDSAGNVAPYLVQFAIDRRPVGSSTWFMGFVSSSAGGPAQLSRVAYGIGTSVFSPGVKGPQEIRVRRLTGSGGSLGVSQAVVRQINYKTNQQFSYPRCALVALELDALQSVVQGRPGYLVRMKGLRVRVYDATIGGGSPSVNRYWELPAAGDPYASIWSYPPGQNPAWVLGEFLTHPAGLGRHISDDQVDWDSLRDWADWCDRDVSVTGEPNEAGNTFDGVIDEPSSAWDHILRICEAGRAVPVIRNNKIAVKYAYADAHGRGTNSVATKVATQLISTSNVSDFEVRYINTRRRPAVYDVQILNAAEDYAQATIPVEDPNGGFNDPTTENPLGYTKKTRQGFGTTRITQAKREALFRHLAGFHIRSQIAFTIGPEALAAEVGDVIAVQHDAFRPFASSVQIPLAYRFAAASSGTTVTLDRPVTIGAGSYELAIRDANGDIVTRAITDGPGTIPAGDPVTLASAVTVTKSGLCAFGEVSSVTKDYEITRITLNADLRRVVEAVEFAPAVHVEQTVSEDVEAPAGYKTSNDLRLDDDTKDKVSTDIEIQATTVRGEFVIQWQQPDDYLGKAARVFIRSTPDQLSTLLPHMNQNPARGSGAVWDNLGESTTNFLRVPLNAGTAYDVAVALQDTEGVFQRAQEAGKGTGLMPPEFPRAHVPSVQGFRVSVQDGRYIFEWAPIENPSVDFVEIRHAGWLGSQVIGRSRTNRLVLEMPATTTDDEPGDFYARAHTIFGLYSDVAEKVSPQGNPYKGRAVLVDQTPDPGASGTLTNLESNSSVLSIVDGKLHGTWESAPIAVPGSFDGKLKILVYYEAWGEDNQTIDEMPDYEIDSGEASWRMVDGREASPLDPGIDPFASDIDDLVGVIDDIDDEETVSGKLGQPGHNHYCKVETRTALVADTLADESYEPANRLDGVFSEFQVRVTLYRSEYWRQQYCKAIRIKVIT